MRVFHRFIATTILTWHALVAAFQFLSRIPIPLTVPFNDRVSRRSLIFFPLVGWVLGLMLCLVAWGASYWFPPIITAVLLLAFWTAFSGGLHLDGWMDTADGVFSHRTKESMLDIMRDSRVGAMGVIAAALALLLKMAVLVSIVEGGATPFLFALALIPMLSRLSMVWSIAFFPYVRKNGIGSLYKDAGIAHVFGAIFVSAVCAMTLYFIFPGVTGRFIWQFIALIVLTIIVAYLLSYSFKRKLDGMTGDTYGFLNEAVEIVLLLAAWVLVMHI